MKSKRLTAMLAAAGAALCAAATLLAQAGGFQFHGPLSRVLTPNGDQKNDIAILCFDNPQDLEVSARVYTLLGARVADMSGKISKATAPPVPGAIGPVACPGGALPNSPQYVFWDGRAEGSTVKSGVYVYHVKAEGLTFSGTLLVVR